MPEHLQFEDTKLASGLRQGTEGLDVAPARSSDSSAASAGQAVCLLYIDTGQELDSNSEAEEFVELVRAVEVDIRRLYRVRCVRPSSRYFIGSGKADEIREYLEQEKIRLLIVNRDLSPGQERNLERLWHARVLGRSGLVLDIFSQRARSHEGKLQVELAQLGYLSTRLVRGWSHLERQKGGIGLRGPGEKQIETDRRLIAKRIGRVNKRLNQIKSRRCLGQQMRRRNEVSTIALVGYTNVGKTSLFNRLTRSEAYSADRLFATLDPMMRRLKFERTDRSGCDAVVVSDTVGFIRDLPPTLVEAFHATLVEVCEADLLVQVLDAALPKYVNHHQEIDQVLGAIGAADIPKITVFNKSDLASQPATVTYDGSGRPVSAMVSALTGAGIKDLKQALLELLTPPTQSYEAQVPLGAESLRAFIYDNGQVVGEEYLRERGWRLQLRLADSAVKGITKYAGKLGCAFELLESHCSQ